MFMIAKVCYKYFWIIMSTLYLVSRVISIQLVVAATTTDCRGWNTWICFCDAWAASQIINWSRSTETLCVTSDGACYKYHNIIQIPAIHATTGGRRRCATYFIQQCRAHTPLHHAALRELFVFSRGMKNRMLCWCALRSWKYVKNISNTS